MAKQTDNPATPLDVTEYEVIWVPVGSLTHNPKNYRRHNEDHILTLRQSLREHGWEQVVIVDPRDHTLILDGHGRELAAQAEGLARMPVHVYHGTSPEKWIVTANESDRQATVDQTGLAALLAELQTTVGLDGTGHDSASLDALIGSLTVPDFAPVGADEQGRLDQLAPKPVTCPHCGETFDLREAEQA